MENNQKIYFHGSIYVLLLFVLLNDDWERSLYIFESKQTIPATILTYFNKHKINYWGPVYKNTIKSKFLNRLNLYKTVFQLKNNKRNRYYGSDNGNIAKYFIKNDFKIIEDGFINYVGKNIIENFSSRGRFYVCGKKYLPYGYDNIIKTIYLTGIFDIPEELKNRVVLVDIQQLWKSKSINMKNKILELFGVNRDVLLKYALYKNVLLTQPFDDTGIITEEEKINLYRIILKNYDCKTTIIKPHPRESTDYKKKFNEFTVVNEKFPFELFMLLYPNLNKIITINSTAAFSMKSYEIDLYDKNGIKRDFDIRNQGITFILQNGIFDNNERFDKDIGFLARFVLKFERLFCYKY